MKSEVDVLLTKYLDGDLTAAEDRTLREMLSEHPDAKLAFDESVAIHHALRSDAESLEAPADLVEQTEEAVLMRIFGEAPADKAIVIPPVLNGVHRKVIGSVLLLLAFMMPNVIGDAPAILHPIAQSLENSILLTSAEAAVSERASVEVQNAALVQSWTQANYDRISGSIALIDERSARAEQLAAADTQLAAQSQETQSSQLPLAAATPAFGPADEKSAASAFTEGFDVGLFEHDMFGDPIFGPENDLTPNTASGIAAESDSEIFSGDAAGSGLASNASNSSGNDLGDAIADGSGGIVALTPGIAPSLGGEIFLSGTLGSDLIAQNSSDEADALSLSTLGLAYSVNPNGRVGLELGMINFSYPYQTLVWSDPVGITNDVTSSSHYQRTQRPIKTQTGSSRSPVASSGSDGGTEEDPTPSQQGPGQETGSDDGPSTQGEGNEQTSPGGGLLPSDQATERQAYSVSEIRNKTTVWGGVFYEHEIPIRERISFIGRIGAGGSNEGMLGYLRASGAYEMTDDLSLLFGFDSRAMLLSVFEYKNVSKLNVSFTFTMGMNVRL